MNTLSDFLPLSLIFTSRFFGVLPLNIQANFGGSVWALCTIILCIFSMILTVTVPYSVFSAYVDEPFFTVWLRLLYPIVCVGKAIPAYFSSLYFIRNHLFDVINLINISDSISQVKDEQFKKKHFTLTNMYLVFVFCILPFNIYLLYVVIMLGDIQRLIAFFAVYYGNLSMTCNELQFICFCNCLYNRFNMINKKLSNLLGTVDLHIKYSSNKNKFVVIRNSFLYYQPKPKKAVIESFKQIYRKFNRSQLRIFKVHKTAIKRQKNLQKLFMPPKGYIKSIVNQNTFKSDFRHLLNCNDSVQLISCNLSSMDQIVIDICLLRETHRFLFSAMMLLEKLYRLQITISVFSIFFMALLFAYFELLHYTRHDVTFISYNRYLSLLWLLHYFVRLYLIITQSYATTQEASYAESILVLIDNRQLQVELRYQLTVFLNDIRSTDEIDFATWGFVELSPTLITVAVSSVMTYLIILVQFSQED